MEKESKKCFVISPISDDGSDIRKEADQVLWVIKQVVERYGYKAIRVDEICQTMNITDEIKEYIQHSELCICVLTHSNPNVFYETGLRHSTGKPFIHLMANGHTIPFDVNVLNTIFYDDLSSFEAVQALTSRLEKFVQSIPEIEKEKDKLDIILDGVNQIYDLIKKRSVPSRGEQKKVLSSPISANSYENFMLAIVQGEIVEATNFFKKLTEGALSPKKTLYAAQLLADAGGKSGALYIIENIDSKGLSESEKVALLGAVSSYIARSEDDSYFESLVSKLNELAEKDKQLRPRALNQIQKALYGLGNYEDALNICEEVIQLNPNEPSYYFNASLIYEKLGLHRKALEAADKMLDLDGEHVDIDHLKHAVELYSEEGESDKAIQAYSLLKEFSPEHAAILSLDPDVRRTIGLTRR